MSVTATETGIATAAAGDTSEVTTRRYFLPLIVDVAVPVGTYYLLKSGLGTSTMAALGWSSVVPAVRTLWSVTRERKVNALAALILFVNVAGLLLSLAAGDPRLMLAKDSGVSSLIGIAVLVSVPAGRPMMTPAMKPFVTKGDPARKAAWERLFNGSERFRTLERTFSRVWGVALLGECVVRIVGAYTLPVDTMVWLGTVVMICTMAMAMAVSGGLAAGPMEGMVRAEAGGRTCER
ncbi:VC0807 family protein [Streptomyces sp. NPDC059466]|uniref:VC0807 family protein n=1 Tax=unclassified Streptomyces TaxID=2593676 RepID=UPI0036C0EB65